MVTWFPGLAAIGNMGEIPAGIGITLGWVAALMLTGAYRRGRLSSGPAEYGAVMLASWAVFGIFGVTAYLFQLDWSRGYFILLFVVTPLLLLVERWTARRLIWRARARGRLTTSVLVAGAPEHINEVVTMLRREKYLGYRVEGILPSEIASGAPTDLPVVGTPAAALTAVESTGAEAVIFAEGSFTQEDSFNQLARDFERHPAEMIVVPSLTDVAAQRVNMRPMGGMPFVFVDPTGAHRAGRAGKRIFDIVGSSLLILLASPVMLLTALAIKLEDHGPVFFKQTRVGRGGVLFDVYKFRSMATDAEARKAALAQQDEGNGVLFKMARDPRVTRVGWWIRRFSIDEIPQFLNVWLGHMSLVGPRPALPREVARYEQRAMRRLDVRPGITGLWQVSGRSDLSWGDTVRLDLSYVDNWSMMQDVNIIGRTAQAVLKGSGAY